MNDDERRHAELTREALADVDTDLVVDCQTARRRLGSPAFSK